MAQIGGFEILRELGEGQFGRVWVAAGEVPGRSGGPGKRRTVAIKQLLSADEEALRLLRQEFDLLDQVKHRSIVQVYAWLPAQRAVVMEFVEGVTLREILERCARAGEPVVSGAAIEIACEAADALYQAYTSPGLNGERLALVHRDLKPENVMLTPKGEVKILDFGLARVGNAEFAREDPRLIKGTPIYMAPEQARGEEIDHRSDLFALGLILYELLMGRPAYSAPAGAADPALAMYQAIERGDLREALRALEDRLPSVGPILQRLLQPGPGARYQSGQELLVALRQRWQHSTSDLQKFCAYYFEHIHNKTPSASAPGRADVGVSPPTRPGGLMDTDKAPSKSIEERLREKEAAAAASSAGRAPVAVVRRAPAPAAAPEARSAPPAPPPAAPPATPKKVDVSPRIIPRTASAARPASEEELPSVKGGKPDARSAGEAGMLQMKPLSASLEEPEPQVDPSATAFFAITPKTAAPRPPDDPPPAPAPTAAPPVPIAAAGPPPSAIDRPAYSPPGVGIGIGVGGAAAVVSASHTPFGGNNAPLPNANQEKDVESSRIWVLLAGMILMSGTLVVGVIVLIFLIPKPEKPAAPAPTPVAQAAPKEKDTGAPPPPATPAQTAKPPPRTSSGPRPTATTAPPPATPKQASGTVSVRFNGATIPTSVELTCDSGFRDRKSVSGGAASFSGVTGNCTAYPKGVTATAFKVSPGRSYSCTITGTTTAC